MYPNLMKGAHVQVGGSISRRAALGVLGGAGAIALTGRAMGLGAPGGGPAVGGVGGGEPGVENANVYRRRVGEVEVFAISDGTGLNLGSPYPLWGANTGKESVEGALGVDLLPVVDTRFYFNATFVRAGGLKILVDLGNKGNAPGSGQLVKGLNSIGVKPGDIDVVIFSHLHPDHFGGLFDGPKEAPTIAFPNARYFVHKDEVDFWSHADKGSIRGQIPEAFKEGMLAGASATLKLLAGRLEKNDSTLKLVPGLTIEPLPGHTPGHQTVRVASGDEQILIMADAVHHPSLSFRNPSMHLQFDVDPEVGAKSRLAFVQRAQAEKMLVLGYHMPFPGIGRVAKDGEGFRWVPEGWWW
ncbi:MAG: MBL fold metallo-hydrolase [bacterium]